LDIDSTQKLLVVNADDLGMSAGVNRGIFEAHERGIVTSASLMVRWAGAREAAAYAKAHPRLGVGLHLDFAEWTIRDEEWVRLYEVVDLDRPREVEAEVARQIGLFRHLMDRPPTHVDSHQHVHQDVRVRRIVEAAAARLGVPLRHDGRVLYCGDFYGQDEHGRAYHDGICADSLARIVRATRAGVTELACHPGYDDGLETMYRDERAMEVAALCDEGVRRAVEESGVRLVNFGEVG
jgi:chitin disaccharide deacetylase